MLKILIITVFVLLVFIVIAFVILNNKLKSKETKYIAQLTEGTRANSFSMDIFYQKVYIYCAKVPFLRRYILKIRRRLEVINLEDEYLTRKQTAQIVFKGLLVVFPLTILVIILQACHSLYYLV